jgi:cell wall-associated NlpC family hydrolase
MSGVINLARCALRTIGSRVGRAATRLTVILTVAALPAAVQAKATASALSGAPVTAGNWDLPAQRAVLRAGLMHNISLSNFAGSQPLSGAQASSAMAALAVTFADPLSPTNFPLPATRRLQAPTVTLAGFDALVVGQVGLGSVAAHVEAAASAAGLAPPPYFGTEVVARFIGLRYTHPVGSEQLALFPTDPITRAEAAWSLARLLATGSGSVAYARSALSSFQLPTLTANERVALRIAASRIGYPYIWGGTTDDTSDGLPHGGFDCSGFVWRVFKFSGLPWGKQILGRTAAQMAGEIARRQRLPASKLLPGDLLFFGTAGPRGVATEASIVHTGIYIGNNWVINSDGQGVSVLPLRGSWLGNEFAWGRRVIPAAGASTAPVPTPPASTTPTGTTTTPSPGTGSPSASGTGSGVGL